MRYRRRLRSRIIISFALFGSALTALFAASAVYLSERLESQLIGETLVKNLQGYAESFYTNPEVTLVPFTRIRGYTFSERKFANVPFAWQGLETGVHDLVEAGGDSGQQHYKLAVRKDQDHWFFLRYDVSQERESQRLLLIALIGAVVAFSALALLIGFWSSTRVMRPVTDLAERLSAFARSGKPQPLAPHFAEDEVGQLAAALDDYATRLTALVERDREFNADVSHELRTPLAVISSATELLLAQDDLPEKVRARLKRIERASRQSTELTTALLLLSRGERQVAGERTDVSKLVDQVIDVNRPLLGNKPVEVRVEREAELDVAAHAAVVAVALGNLIGNAFKYTQAGTVLVRIAEGRVEVEDSGPGIAAEDAGKLFDRGYRGSGASGKGAGLGLAIVRRLCELYGWSVTLEPRAAGGAIATLALQAPR